MLILFWLHINMMYIKKEQNFVCLRQVIYSRLIKVVLIIIFFGWFFSNNVVANETVQVSSHPTYPPIMWQEKDRVVGVAIKLVDYIFNKLNIDYDAVHVGPWKRVHQEAKKGKIDIIAAAYLNEERQKYLLYSEWFMIDPVVLFVWHNNQFEYNTWKDLEDKHGTTHLGESYGEKFDRYIEENLKMDREQKYINHFKKLEHGRVDYFLYGLYPGLIEVHKHGFDNKITYLKNHVVNEKFYLTMSKKSSYLSLMPKINKEIIKIRESSLVEKWIAESIEYFKKNAIKE